MHKELDMIAEVSNMQSFWGSTKRTGMIRLPNPTLQGWVIGASVGYQFPLFDML